MRSDQIDDSLDEFRQAEPIDTAHPAKNDQERKKMYSNKDKGHIMVNKSLSGDNSRRRRRRTHNMLHLYSTLLLFKGKKMCPCFTAQMYIFMCSVYGRGEQNSGGCRTNIITAVGCWYCI